MAAAIKMDEIAARINAHLKRMQADETINQRADGKGKRLYGAYAGSNRQRVLVTYISYQYTHRISKEEALRYLTALDSGYTGRHHEHEIAKFEAN